MAAVPKTNHAIQERVTAIMIAIVPDILYAEPEVVQILHLHLMLMMIAVKYPKVMFFHASLFHALFFFVVSFNLFSSPQYSEDIDVKF